MSIPNTQPIFPMGVPPTGMSASMPPRTQTIVPPGMQVPRTQTMEVPQTLPMRSQTFVPPGTQVYPHTESIFPTGPPKTQMMPQPQSMAPPQTQPIFPSSSSPPRLQTMPNLQHAPTVVPAKPASTPDPMATQMAPMASPLPGPTPSQVPLPGPAKNPLEGYEALPTAWGMPVEGAKVDMPHGRAPGYRNASDAILDGYDMNAQPPDAAPKEWFMGHEAHNSHEQANFGGGLDYGYASTSAQMQGPGAAQVKAELAAGRQRQQDADDGIPPGYKKAPNVIHIKLPKQISKGGQEFLDYYKGSERCVSRRPEYGLEATAEIPEKTWLNHYVYTPEKRSHADRQFLQRYKEGPDGVWLDTVKAQRLSGFINTHRKKGEADDTLRDLIAQGAAVPEGTYNDAYNGAPMALIRGEMVETEKLKEIYRGHRSEWKDKLRDLAESADFDNLRIEWPFGRPDRNKRLSMDVYNGFDRNCDAVKADRDYPIYEMPSMYVEQTHFNRMMEDFEAVKNGPSNFVASQAIWAAKFMDVDQSDFELD